MVKFLYVLGFLLIFGGLTYHFAALRVFNTFVPVDAGVDVAATDLAYGSDPRQRLDIYKPNQSQSPLPILVFVHGGGWDSGDKRDYSFVGRAFAAQGYLTAVINYRLVPKNVFPNFVTDTALAVAKLQQLAGQYGGDPSRVYLVGHSAGGYNVLLSVLDPQYLNEAGVKPDTIRGVAALAAPADFLPLDTSQTLGAFSRWPRLEETQPVTFARKDAPPILLLHGSDDRTVFTRNSRNMKAKLDEAGAVAQYTEYPGVSHVKIMLSLAKPLRGHVPVLADITQFFVDHR